MQHVPVAGQRLELAAERDERVLVLVGYRRRRGLLGSERSIGGVVGGGLVDVARALVDAGDAVAQLALFGLLAGFAGGHLVGFEHLDRIEPIDGLLLLGWLVLRRQNSPYPKIPSTAWVSP